MSQDAALLLALSYAQAGSQIGYLEGSPTEIRGQLMAVDQPTQFVGSGDFSYGAQINPASQVWVFVLRGQVIGLIPPSAVGSAREPPRIYHQMSMVIDAVTGERLISTHHPPTNELDASALPVITLPGPGTVVPPPPTLLTYPTTAPNPEPPVTVIVVEQQTTPVTFPTATPYPLVVPTRFTTPYPTRDIPYPAPMPTPAP